MSCLLKRCRSVVWPGTKRQERSEFVTMPSQVFRRSGMKKVFASGMAAVIVCFAAAFQATAQSHLDQQIDANIQEWVGTYQHLHRFPELSTAEKETSAYVAAALKGMGYEVTDHFGKYEDPSLTSYGVVAVMKHGLGPTVWVRTELDALPVTEKTGVPYASQVTVNRGGGAVGVMHACGHDLHMTVFLGTAKILAESQSQWTGTVVMLGQPAEETVGGA